MASLFECPVCIQNFDLLSHLPRRLPCEHLVCSDCLAQTLNHKDRPPRCPLDNSELPLFIKTPDGFPVCLVLRQLLEQRAKEEICPTHNQKISFICLNDKKKICNKCLESQYHQFMELDGLKKRTGETRQKIKQFAKDVTIFHKNIQKKIAEMRQNYMNNIHQKFGEFKSLLDKKEQDLTSEVDSYFDSQKMKIESLLGEDSKLLRDLTDKESKLENEDLLADTRVFENIEKQINEWILKISSEDIYNKFWEKLEQNDRDFCGRFTLDQNEFLSKTQATRLGSDEYLINNIFMMPNNQTILNDQDNYINGEKVKSLLNFELIDDCLTITTANKHKEILIEADKWNQANEVKLTLDKTLSEDDESLLNHIWKGFKTVKSLHFKFHSGTVSKSLSEILSGGVSTFSSISIDIKEYDVVKYPEVLLLIKQVLCKTDNLHYLALYAQKAKFPQNMENILNAGFFDGKKLEYFILDFEETNVIDEDIQNMFVAMPDLEYFYLKMNKTKITDKALEICGKNTLSTTQKLKSLNINVRDNLSVTDYGIDFVLQNYTNLTVFQLFLSNTGITDKTIKLLSERMSNQFINFLTFRLALASTKITDYSFSQFFRPMPKLQDYTIGFYNTAITDKTIINLVQNTLMSIAKPLTEFCLIVGRTKCTDRSISELLENLNCEKKLYLYLDCEGVTDTGLGSFVREKLPTTMTKLEELKFFICNTTVSQEIKDKINGLMKRINK